MKMERITSEQVISMMDAVAQVYEQPEVEQLDEIVRNLRPGETIKQYDERKKKEKAEMLLHKIGIRLFPIVVHTTN